MREEMARRKSNAELLVDALAHGDWRTHAELMAAGVGNRYGARIFDLRQRGYQIEKRHDRGGLWSYRLASPPTGALASMKGDEEMQISLNIKLPDDVIAACVASGKPLELYVIGYKDPDTGIKVSEPDPILEPNTETVYATPEHLAQVQADAQADPAPNANIDPPVPAPAEGPGPRPSREQVAASEPMTGKKALAQVVLTAWKDGVLGDDRFKQLKDDICRPEFSVVEGEWIARDVAHQRGLKEARDAAAQAEQA